MGVSCWLSGFYDAGHPCDHCICDRHQTFLGECGNFFRLNFVNPCNQTYNIAFFSPNTYSLKSIITISLAALLLLVVEPSHAAVNPPRQQEPGTGNAASEKKGQQDGSLVSPAQEAPKSQEQPETKEVKDVKKIEEKPKKVEENVEKSDDTYNSLNKYNFIFYFIYKYKYDSRSTLRSLFN
jgi:hypothetical protein